jgi:hypothetical protein
VAEGNMELWTWGPTVRGEHWDFGKNNLTPLCSLLCPVRVAKKVVRLDLF